MTNDLSAERGRPFYLAARVAGSLEMCRRIGYDIPTWIDEGLVDILIPAGGASTDASIDVKGFVEVCQGTDVAVYPGFDAQVPGTAAGPEDGFTKDQMLTRAISSRYHAKGADGIYVFNWHANAETRRELLSQIGSPETLQGKDKVYAATHRHLVTEGDWRGAFHIDRIWGQVPVALKRTITGDGPTIALDVADGFSRVVPASIELRVRLEEWVKGDVVRVWWGRRRAHQHRGQLSPRPRPVRQPVRVPRFGRQPRRLAPLPHAARRGAAGGARGQGRLGRAPSAHGRRPGAERRGAGGQIQRELRAAVLYRSRLSRR